MIKVAEYGKHGSGPSIAVASMHVEYDKKANLEKYREFMTTAKSRQVDLIVFPEMSLQGHLWINEPSWCLPVDTARYHWDEAETVPGESTDRVCEWAAELDMYVVFGLGRRGPFDADGIEMLFNSAVLIGPKGVIGIHDKVHNPGGEKHIFRSGAIIEAHNTPLGKIGLLICWDVAFPEHPRVLALKGADMLVVCTAWSAGTELALQHSTVRDPGHSAYELLIRARAVENNAWVFSSNWVGVDSRSGLDFAGGSAIIHPMGVALAEIGGEEGLAIAHDLAIHEERRRARTEYLFGNDVFLDRRPELYSSLARTYAPQ